MPTAKIKRLNYDAPDTFEALKPYVVYAQNELTVHDNNLCYKLDQAEKNSKLVVSLKQENTQLKEKQGVMSALTIERDSLKRELANAQEDSKSSSEYKTQNVQCRSEISKLKSECKKHLDQVEEFNNKIKSLEKDNQGLQKNNQSLQSEKQKLEATNKQLTDVTQEKEDIKTFFSKWGSYTSLTKDIQIIRFFLSRPGKEIRQKTIIDAFNSMMDKSTIRNHLYRLVKKGILEEPQFRGSYRLNKTAYFDMAKEIDEIISVVIGRDLFEMAITQHQQKNEQSEE